MAARAPAVRVSKLPRHIFFMILVVGIHSLQAQDHFQFVTTNNYQTIYLHELTYGYGVPLDTDDEIGVFDGDLCVGAEVYSDGEWQQMQAWVDDSQTNYQDGFIEGNLMSFRFWDASLEEEFIVDGVEYIEDVDNGWDTSGEFHSAVIAGVNLSGRNWPTYVYPDDFVHITGPSSGAVLGMVTIDGVPPVEGEDIIAAFEPVGGICVGTGSFLDYPDWEMFGNIIGLNIYGDDTTTPEDDGMNPGDNFLLVVYDASENRTITYTGPYTAPDDTSFSQWENTNGGPMPAYNDYTQVYSFVCDEDEENCWVGEALNNPPVADDLSLTTDEDILLEIILPGSDGDGDSLTFSIVNVPLSGIYL